MTWTHTSRGRALDLLDPQIEDVDIDEIGHALSQQCRFAGCVSRFYSVAEHSVLIAGWLEFQGAPTSLVLAGLLHDAAEAYTGDITWPMQQVLFDGFAGHYAGERYRSCQRRLDALICQLVGLPVEWLHDERVKEADLRILLDERAALLAGSPREWPIETEMGLKPLGVTISGWEPAHARRIWAADVDRLAGSLR